MTKHEDVTKQGFSKKLGRFVARSLRAWAINRWKKTRIRNLQFGPKKRG